MRRLMMPLCLLLSACSFHSQAVSAVDSVAGLRREIAQVAEGGTSHALTKRPLREGDVFTDLTFTTSHTVS
jgi:hypothetical protein